MKVCVIICAAGKGERAGFEKNKLLAPLPLYNCTVLEKTVSAFIREDISRVVVAVSPADREEIAALLSPYPLCELVEGGDTRTQSVRNALARVREEIVLVHDGARPYVSDKIVADCIESVKKYGSGICALPATDTTVIAPVGEIENVPPRAEVYTVQTPQGFFTADLVRAYERAGEENFTDDSAVYAKYIARPRLFTGERRNKKVTYREDFEISCRTGVGIDTHAFGKAQDYVTLGGVKIPSDSGFIAHSDGDVVIHALMDALLSAAGLRDIGHYFPDVGDEWRGADSMKMLKIVLEEVKKQGLIPCNVSIAIQAQKPRLAKYIPLMVEKLAAALSLPRSCVGVTAGTNEGLGYVGEGKGVTVTANALLCAAR